MEKKILIIGATSFVGKRFIKTYAPYFFEHNYEVTASARNEEKLKFLLSEFPFIHSMNLDTLKKEEVFKAVQGHYLVVNFAGPFDLYAENVVAACARFGCHYIDITGEFGFAKRMRETYQEEALKNKAKIIPFCGFDSIPSDYAVFLSKEFAKERKIKIESFDILYQMRGGFNGGTIKTAFDVFPKIPKEDLENRGYLLDSKINSPINSKKARYIQELNSWGIPFFMEPINSKVVYLSSYQWSREYFVEKFDYRESLKIPGGMIPTKISSFISSHSDLLFKNSFTKKILADILPKPGEGPKEEAIQNGFLKAKYVARFSNNDSLLGSLEAEGDPGNIVTIKCLASAMKAILDEKFKARFGILTPVGAFEEDLIPYLESEGIKFKFHKHT